MLEEKRRNRAASFKDGIQVILCFVCGGALFYTLLQNFDLASRTNSSVDNFLVVGVAVVALGLPFIVRLVAKWLKGDIYKLLILLVVLSLVIRAGVAHGLQTPPDSDFVLLYKAARKAAEGDYSWAQSGYFSSWAYQIPFVLAQSVPLRVIDSIDVLKAINVVFMALSNFFIFLIARELASEKAGIYAFVLYMVYPAPLLFAPVLTNQHISTMLMLAGVYVFIKNSKRRLSLGKSIGKMALAGGLLALGNLFRSEGAVIILSLCGIAAVAAITALLERKARKLVLARSIAVVVATYMLLMQAASGLLIVTNLSETGATNNFPQWKVVTGLNPENHGKYIEKDSYIFKIEDNGERWRETLDIIKNNFNGFSKKAFLEKKTEIMWAEKEAYYLSVKHIDIDKLFTSGPLAGKSIKWLLEKIVEADKGLYIAVIALALVYVVRLVLSERGHGLEALLLPAMFLVNYLAYLLIEIQTRYRYFIMPFVFIMAAAGVFLKDENGLLARKKALC